MRRPKTLFEKKYQAIVDEEDKVKIRCSCGKRVIVPMKSDKVLCNWCGNWVYRNKKLEFIEKMKKELKK